MDNNIKNKTLSSLFWKFGERISVQFVSFVVSIILARLLLPAEYGTVALVTIFISIASIFVISGFGNALIQKKNADELDYSSVLFFSIVISAVFYGIIFFCAPIIGNYYENPQLIPLIRVLALQLPISGINSVQNAYVAQNMIFKKFFLSTLIGTVISAVIGITMAYHGFGVWALVAQNLINIFVNTVVLFITLKWKPKAVFSFARLKGLFSFGWKLLVSGLINMVYNQINGLIIGKKYSTASLAYYNKGNQFPDIFVTNINSSIDAVMFPVLSKEQDNKIRIKDITRRAIKTSSYLLFPILTGLAVTAEPIVRILLTDKWLPCVPFMRILCLYYALMPFQTANLQAIKALGRSDIFLKLEILKKVFGLAILFFLMQYGAIWIAWSILFSAIISLVINSFPNLKLINYSLSEQIKDIFPYLIMTLIMGGCVYTISLLSINIYLMLIVQVIIGILIYWLISFLFKVESYAYLKKTIKEFFYNKKN